MSEASSGPTLIYDGDCGFCSTSARWLAKRRASPARFDIRPYQRANLDRLGLSVEQCAAAVQWVDADGIRTAQDAIAKALIASRPPWSAVGRIMRRRPVRAVASVVYRWVARHRHRLPGGTPTCRLPPSP